MTDYLGVIGGSSFIKSEYFSNNSFTQKQHSTTYGDVLYYINEESKILFVQRHAADPAIPYTPPHLINKKAILTALKELGATRVLAFNSTGSMKKTIGLGSIVVPSDFLCLEQITFHSDYAGHLIPGFDQDFRSEVITLLRSQGIPHVPDAVYYQSQGPRFETAAEIQLFASTCDIVGMTCAHEAILAKEIQLPYVSVCMVDNMANGITSLLTTDDFHSGVNSNLNTMENLLTILLSALSPAASQASGKVRVETLIHARWIVPICPDDRVLNDHSIAIDEKGLIVDILPTSEAKEKYIANTTKTFKSHAVIPGLVNAHTHLGMTMARGVGDDKLLLDWLMHDIWPLEAKFMSHDFVYDGSSLGMAELLKGGCTCFNDMYFEPSSTIAAMKDLGMRGMVGGPIFDVPDKDAGKAIIKKTRTIIEQYREQYGDDPHDIVTFSITPHAPYTVSDDSLQACLQTAKDLGIPIHTHLHETRPEVEDSEKLNRESPSCHRSDNATSPLENFIQLGFADHPLIAVHMAVLTDEHVEIVAKHKANISVVHCPVSNLKLASGFCPIKKLSDKGITIAIGTDSTGSNNSLDMFAEMKTAAILAKAVSGDPCAIPAFEALRMATINGAKVLQLDHKIGSIEVGKYADIVAVDLHSVNTLPLYDVISHLVYSTTRDHVTDVWVNGRHVVQNKSLPGNKEKDIIHKVQMWNVAIADWKSKQQSNQDDAQPE